MSAVATVGSVDPLADLLAAAGPDHFRAGVPAAGSLPLEAFHDTDRIDVLVDAACRAAGRDERTAAGFSLYYGAVGAYLGPAVAAVLTGRRDVLDPARTGVGFDGEGFVDAVWPAWHAGSRDGTDGDPVAGTAAWLEAGIATLVDAFRPHLRVGPRSYAAAAGDVLAKLAENAGRATGRVAPARAAVAALVGAIGPAIRTPRYVDVALGPGRATAPSGTVCCQWFRLGGGFCAGCPRQPEPDRSAGLLEYLGRTLQPAVDDVAGTS